MTLGSVDLLSYYASRPDAESLQMPLEDSVETFSAFIKEAVKLNIAYITVSNYNAYTDPKIDGMNLDWLRN